MIDNFESLKRRVADVQSRRDRSIGAREQLIKRLKEKFGVDTLEKALVELEKAKDEELAAARKYTKRKEQFEKEFESKIREVEDE